MSNLKPFLKTKEVKAIYGISLNILIRREQEGKLTKYRFGERRSVYWKATEIEKLFEPQSHELQND
jgi:hypothetical protein